MEHVSARDAFRVWWVDYCGLTRLRVVPGERVLRSAKAKEPVHVGITPACMGMPPMADRPPRDSPLSVVGEVQLSPDWSSLRQVLLRREQAASVENAAERSEKRMLFVGGDFTELDASRWAHCPRGFAQRQVDALEREHGVTLKMGFETEFVLFEQRGQGGPLGGDATYCGAEKYAHASAFLEELVESLASAGIGVEQLHAESAPGQFEVSTGYEDALTAADNVVLTRAVISTLALDHNLRASFSPKPFAACAGNGVHAHFSLWRNGENQFGDAAQRNSFLAGVLESAPALAAICSSSPLSYERLQPSTWSGAWHAYGAYNRECCLRLIPHEGHAEFKAVDASANPYLVAGCIAASGNHGIRNALSLPVEQLTDPATSGGVMQDGTECASLPGSLEAALEALCAESSGAPLREALGPDAVAAFCAAKRLEHALAAEHDVEKRRSLYKFRY
mmetsp:Transcript_7940/g.21042  ORF Transcript_7940/g.21042 Transcript_7940/m.21042 type:complete len:450 (+) Transcript_7940:3-1352(+)